MPLRVTCGDCGKVLYEGPDVKSPFEIATDHDGRCPGCRRRLSQTPRRCDVRPADSAGNPS